jgi:hypothetical protein
LGISGKKLVFFVFGNRDFMKLATDFYGIEFSAKGIAIQNTTDKH